MALEEGKTSDEIFGIILYEQCIEQHGLSPEGEKMAYQRPMVTVDQNMTITPTSIERDQPALIFGPNYELHRYSSDAEKASTAVNDTYKGSAIEFAYPNVIDDSAVDKSYTKLFGDNVVVKLCDLTSGTSPVPANATLVESGIPSELAKNGGYTRLLLAGAKFVKQSSGDTLDGGLLRNLVAGDRLAIRYKETPQSGTDAVETEVVTKIVSVKYGSSWNFYESSSDSVDDPESGAGTQIVIEDAIPETVVSNSVKVSLVVVIDGQEFTRKDYTDPGEYQWTQEKLNKTEGGTYNGIKVNSLNVLVPSYSGDEETYYPVLQADLFLTYRELNPAYTDTLHNLTGASQVANSLGTIDPDNPLAMGVYMAALNAATDDGDEAPPVYYMAVPLDGNGDLEWAAVLNKASLTDKAYVFAPTTRDDKVLDMVQNHVLEMSTKTVKMWRIAALSKEVPRDVAVLSSLLDNQNDEFLAIPVSETAGTTPKPTAPSDTKYTMFRVVKGIDNINGSQDTAFRSTVVAGDRVKFFFRNNAWNEETCDEYIVKRVVNNYTVEIDLDKSNDPNGIVVDDLSKNGTTSYLPIKIEIYHEYTSKQSADVIASISRAMASRRALNVFPSYFENDGVEMSGEFAACAIAGLISATEPQQPITNVTVRGIDEIPLVYQTYNNAELDTIASGGTFIVMQDLPHDKVYVRHQITTAYPDGNLNTAELSITKNVDHISYAFAEVFRPYYGKYNITPDLLVILENLAGQLISQFGASRSVYGPQLIVENTRINYVRQNELMKDHVDISITLGVPYPCNNIDIVLTV